MKGAVGFVALFFAAVLSGCGTSPPVSFYTLASEPAAASGGDSAYSVVVGPITVPELVDRPQFVLRSGPSRVEIEEQARWAAPLKSEIPRVIADHLGRTLAGARASSSAQRASVQPDYRVTVDIQRFEMSAQDGATVEALWSVRPRGGPPVGGRSLVTEPAGAGHEGLVAAQSRALERVSADIAAALSALRSQK